MYTLTNRIYTRAVLAFAGLLLLLSLGAGQAAAQERPTRITMQQAERIALQHVPNAVIESIERDVENGVAVFEVELRAPDGVEHELVIDANDGRVIRAEIDD